MLHRALLEARSLTAMARAGVLPLARPDHTARMALAMKKYGPFGGAVAAAAGRHGSQVAIADERGEITYAELDATINRLSNTLRATTSRARPSAS